MTEIGKSKILALFSRPSLTVPILLLFVAVSYANTLYSPFVLDDMHSFIDESRVYVSEFSYESFSRMSDTKFGAARLIPMITFSVNHLLSKGQMPIYHITNIVIHLLATLAVYLFIKTLFRTPIGSRSLRGIPATWFAFFVAALWSLNPVQTNAVTYIVQRMTSLSALFYIASLTMYVKSRLALKPRSSAGYFLLAVIMAVCAFLSKENSYTLPLAVVLVEWIFISPKLLMDIVRKLKWSHWVAIILLVLFLLPLAGHKWTGFLNTYSKIRPFTMGERVLTEARVVVYYISLLLVPLPGRMALDYDFPVSASIFSPMTTFVSLALLTILFFWSLRNRGRHPLIAFGILWYFLNIVIESSVVPLELVFEHRLYTPSVGIFTACLGILDLLVAYLKKKRSPVETEQLFVLVMLTVAIFFSIGTSVRNHVWRDVYALHADNMEKSPDKPRTVLNLGVAMGGSDEREMESISLSEKAIAMGKPKREEYYKAVNNIVVSLLGMKKTEEAIARGEQYIKAAPSYVSYEGYPRLLYNLAIANYEIGQYGKAMQMLASAYTLHYQNLNTYILRLMAKFFTDAYDDQEFREKLELTDENGDKMLSVRLRLARLLYDLKDYEKAEAFLRPVLEKYPDHKPAKELNGKIAADSEKNLTQNELTDIRNHTPYKNNRVYRISLDLADWVMRYYAPLNPAVGRLLDQAARASNPDDPFVLLYRIKWHNKRGDQQQLIRELERAAELQPDFVPLLKLIAEYYEAVGELDKAAQIYSHILELYPGDRSWVVYTKKIADYQDSGKKYEQ